MRGSAAVNVRLHPTTVCTALCASLRWKTRMKRGWTTSHIPALAIHELTVPHRTNSSACVYTMDKAADYIVYKNKIFSLVRFDATGLNLASFLIKSAQFFTSLTYRRTLTFGATADKRKMPGLSFLAKKSWHTTNLDVSLKSALLFVIVI